MVKWLAGKTADGKVSDLNPSEGPPYVGITLGTGDVKNQQSPRVQDQKIKVEGYKLWYYPTKALAKLLGH